MGTSFFHESHFQGLLERVRERGRANVAQRVADQVSRLFHQSDASDTSEDHKVGSGKHSEIGVAKKKECMVQNISEVSGREGKVRQVNSISVVECSSDKDSSRNGGSSVIMEDSNNSGSGSSANKETKEFLLSENLVNLERRVVTAANNHNRSNLHDSDDGVREIVKEQHSTTTTKSSGGSGPRTNGCYNNKLHGQSEERNGSVGNNTAKHNGCYGTQVSTTTGSSKSRHAPPGSGAASSEPHNSRRSSDVAGATGTPSLVSNSHVCVKLCSLIKAQLVKAHGEVTRRFGGNQGLMTLSDAFNTRSPIDNGSHKDESETVEEESDVGAPMTKKKGKETLVPAETNKPERAWDTPETQLMDTEESKTQPPASELLSEKVKDGLMDMFHALSRLGGSPALPSQSLKPSDTVEKEETPAPLPPPPPPPPLAQSSVEEKAELENAASDQGAVEDADETSCGEGMLFSI